MRRMDQHKKDNNMQQSFSTQANLIYMSLLNLGGAEGH